MNRVGVLILLLLAGIQIVRPDAANNENPGLEPATLDQCLALAAAENPRLEAALHRWKAAMERIPQARALPDPRFAYGYFVEPVETRVGPQRQRFSLTQTFPWFGTRSAKSAGATASALAERQTYEAEKRRLFRAVKEAWYEYYFLGKSLAITRSHRALIGDLESVARTRYTSGTTGYDAVMQAQVELGKMEDRVQTLEALRTPTLARLNALLARVPDAPIPWPQNLPEADRAISDAEAREGLLAGNTELRRLEALKEKEDAAVRVARRSAWPEIMLGVDYIDTGDAGMPNTSDSGKDPIIVTAALNLPIWFGKNRAANREAIFRRAVVIEERADAENRLLADMDLALYRYRDAGRKMALYRDTLLPKAEQSLSVARQGFEAGSASFNALMDAERMLLEFQLALEQARVDQARALAEIEALTHGELAPKEGT